MKKSLSVLLMLLILVSLFAACGKDEAETADNAGEGVQTNGETKQEEGTSQETDTSEAVEVKAPEDTLVCLSISTTQNDFMAFVQEQLGIRFVAGGYQWEAASADGSAQRQIEQIENFITMGADEIIVMAVESSSLTDVCQRAMDQGVKIYAFTTNTGAYDAFMGSDEFEVGESIANLASKWVNDTFPEAADGSVDAVIFSYSGNPDAAARSEGLLTIEDVNRKVKIVNVVEIGNSTDQAQMAAENLGQTNPETDLIICYNGAQAIGANAYVMSPGSVFDDIANFGIFGSELTEEVIQNIELSKTNESAFRGTAQLGGDIMVAFDNIFATSVAMMNGEEYLKEDYAQVDEIDASNLIDFLH